MFEIRGNYCKDCIVYADTIEDEAISTIQGICDNPAFKDSKIRIMPDCLTESTEILTSTGFKKIINLNKNDLINNYDPITKKIIFNNPIGIVIRSLKPGEKVYRYKCSRNNYIIDVSENHRMAYLPSLGEVAKNIKTFKLKENIWGGTGIFENNYCTKYSDNDIRLICWIIGDGSWSINKTVTPSAYRIRFGLKKERKIKRVLELLHKEKLSYHSYVDKRGATNIYISTKDSLKYVNYLNRIKKFPLDFLSLSPDQANIFFEELIKIDGDYETYIKYGSYRISSVDFDTISLIQAIASINGKLSSFRIKTPNKGSYPTNKTSYYVNLIKESQLFYSKGGIHNSTFIREELNYSGKLVCVETNTGFFIARQNGLTFITGNCHQGKGIVIGFTCPVSEYVNPAHIGVDIGCQMTTIQLSKQIEKKDYPTFERRLRNKIPTGFEIQSKVIYPEKDLYKFLEKEYRKARSSWPEMIPAIDRLDERFITKLCQRVGIEERLFYKSIGTIGGGEGFDCLRSG